MKKVLATGLLAICAIALTQQQASAWINYRFGVGLNWAYQSGGNCWGWGAWRNGQPPGPEAFNSGPFQPYGPVFPNYGPPPHSHHDMPLIEFGHSQATPPYAPAMPQYAQPLPQYGSPFQFATNPRPAYYSNGR